MLVVFDLDFTLWDCGGTWCDHTNPPYRRKNGYIIDSAGRFIELYPGVPELLEELFSRDIKMALASRTHEPLWARELMRLFEIEHYFDIQQIFPGSKTSHFNHLKKETGLEYNQMFFFDDEYRNIDDVSRLGVKCMHVKNGISKHEALQFIQNG